MKASRSLFTLLAVLLWSVPAGQTAALSAASGGHGPALITLTALSSAQTDAAVVQQAQDLLTLSEQQNFENHALALQTARQALALWQTTTDRAGVARTYAHIGRCYMAQGDLSAAISNYEQAQQLWQELNNAQEQAEVLIMLGLIEIRRGEWTSAVSFLNQAQSIPATSSNPAQMGQIACGLGDIFTLNGLPDNGLIQYNQALEYYRQTPDLRDDTLTTIFIGNTHYVSGAYEAALKHYRQALASVAPASLDAAHCHEYIGRVYLAQGDYVGALPELQTALTTYTNTVNPNEAAQVRALIGQIHEQQGQLKLARRYYEQALATFTKLADRLNQAASYYALGQLAAREQNYDAAAEYLRQSIALTEDVRRVATSSELTAAFSATVHARYEQYIDCLMHQHAAQPAQDFAVRAFEISELARARSLAQLLHATQTNLAPGVDDQLAKQERSLRQLLRVKADDKIALLGRAYKREELLALEAELARLENEYRQVIDTIRARCPAYEQLARPTAWDLRRIQEQVVADDETLLLEYSLGAARSYVWAVTRDRFTSYELPAEASIKAAEEKVYQALKTPPDARTAADLDAAAQALAQMILSPVAAELNKRRIIVVADGALNYIPFQVLPAPSGANEPLVVNYEIINAPSASILGDLQQEAARRQPANVLAAFGDPVFASNYEQRKDTNDNGQLAAMQTLASAGLYHALRDLELNGDRFDPTVLKPLFYAKRELDNLRAVAAGGKTFVAMGADATRAQLLSTDLTQYAILHFATHGFLDPKQPEMSGLVLSTVDRDGHEQNGFVGLQDIYGLRAPVDLVVLSACQTALGKDVRGEGLLGLTRGFMYAGASSVVASLWKVDDEATAELMREFYSQMLQEGLPPAAALRAAQNRIRQNPDWHAPYYWAAFTLQGEYRHVIKPAPAAATVGLTLARKGIMGGTLLTLLVGAAWWYRRRRLRLK